MRTILHSQPGPRQDVLAHLSDNLRTLRRERGVSQSLLAETSGLSRRIISAIEGGAVNVSLSTVDRLAEALGCKLTDLVRPPGASDARHINSIGWRGSGTGSEGVLLGAAPASSEAELWLWSLVPGERYASEAGSEAWHEMLYVLEGVLTLEFPDKHISVAAGDFLIFSTGDAYAFVNATTRPVRYIRNVVL